MNRLILPALLIAAIFSACADTNKNFLESEEAYFGLTPPGLVPEVFAPGIVSDTTWAEHCQLAVSPDGKEIYWSAWTGEFKTEDSSANTEQIFYSKYEKGAWAKPGIAEFAQANPYFWVSAEVIEEFRTKPN